jgi:CBS domain containing-hemolysin-like protein
VPVYRGELDNIIGMLLVPDLVRAVAAPSPNFSLASIIREPRPFRRR